MGTPKIGPNLKASLTLGYESSRESEEEAISERGSDLPGGDTPITVSSDSEAEMSPPGYSVGTGWRVYGALPAPYARVRRIDVVEALADWDIAQSTIANHQRAGRLAEAAELLWRWDAKFKANDTGRLAKLAIYRYLGDLDWLEDDLHHPTTREREVRERVEQQYKRTRR